MGLVFGALGNPATEQFLLGGCERLVGLRRRHEVVGIGAEDPMDQLTGLGVSRFEGLSGQSFLAEVETEFSLPGVFVGSVAMEAGVGQDGTDVPIVLDPVGGVGRRQEEAGNNPPESREQTSPVLMSIAHG